MKVAIGGMIGSGKSTLTKKLASKLKYDHMEEYEKKDMVFNTLLKWLYDGVEDVEMLLQIYFLHNHWKNQKRYTGNLIMDRDVIEHWIFAQENLKTKPEVMNMYNGLFHQYMNSHIKPDLYLILDIDWTTFKKRVRTRGRAQEIDSFDANADYFINLIKNYTKKLAAQCDLYDIPYVIIDANSMTQNELADYAHDIVLSYV